VFKNLTIFSIKGFVAQPPGPDMAFEPCGPTQQTSIGWVPPRPDEFGMAPLIEIVNGQVILTVRIEKRVVPGATLKAEVDRKCKAYFDDTGSKAGKRLKTDYKEAALLELLPRAFPKATNIPVWIRPDQVIVGSTSSGAVDAVMTLLAQSYEGVELRLLNTVMSPAKLMSVWLHDGSPDYEEFSIDRACQLDDPSEMRSTVRYARAPLDTEEVKAHIRQGMVASSLALTWRDRVSFKLTDAMQIKGIDFLDVVMEGRDADADAFDADVAIATGELVQLIDDLINALDGVQS